MNKTIFLDYQKYPTLQQSTSEVIKAIFAPKVIE